MEVTVCDMCKDIIEEEIDIEAPGIFIISNDRSYDFCESCTDKIIKLAKLDPGKKGSK